MPLTMGTSSQLGSATLSSGSTTALSGAATFSDLCDIYSNQPSVANGIGGYSDNWVKVLTGIACSIVAKTPHTEREDADKTTSVGMYLFTLPVGTVVGPSYRIKCNGSTFEVQDRNPIITNEIGLSVWTRLVE